MPRRKNEHDGGQRRSRRRPQRHKDVLHARDVLRARGGHRANDFRCVGCRLDVPLDAPGTAHRNHCPNCLVSLHVDRRVPGDRAADCRGRMAALSMSARPDGEWLIIHQCLSCGELSANRIAGDDNPLALVRLVLRPLRDNRMAGRALLRL
ncbi:RNHCP domain-containing protein [Kitasatospora sp. NPDC004745]|uniref:RNHCP domain-containing protein n=1 Tax=unclassified Kitasatospora TaxID=2633591 RepID=UPI0036A57A8A